ncbi:MAG: TetR family transcriptional regulator [Candidatus Hydrogenedentes bacterium]|nr:TetR family transcriptional regulator [Candidatus Hydrogenedentota bacterium]
MTPKPTKKSEATKALILSTALGLFQEHGFEKTTMRKIAEACDLSLGAAYYHFKTKEELVLCFYAETGAEAQAHNATIVAASKEYKTRMKALLLFKLDQMMPFRELVTVLAQQAADWRAPLSPFSPQSKPMRNEAVGLIEEVLEGSNVKVAKQLRPHLAKMLWLYQMGIILFWVNDRSPQQRHTEELITLSLALLYRLFQASTLPFLSGVNQSAARIVALVEGIAETGQEET